MVCRNVSWQNLFWLAYRKIAVASIWLIPNTFKDQKQVIYILVGWIWPWLLLSETLHSDLPLRGCIAQHARQHKGCMEVCVCASYILYRLRWAHFPFVKEILERVLLLHASLEKTYEAQGQNSHIFYHSRDIFQHMSMNLHLILHFKVLNGRRRTWSQRK